MSQSIYQIDQTGSSGVLVDIFPQVVASVSEDVFKTFVWTIFDLTWIQTKNGLLQHTMLEERSRQHSAGLRLDVHGIYFFLSQADQVVDGLFIGDNHFRSWIAEEPPEELLRNSALGLRVFDSSFWQVSSSISSVNELVATRFEGRTI